MCIALVESGWQQEPRTPFGNDILGCAIAALSLRGQLAEARVLLKKNPSTDALLNLAIDRRHQALWPEIDGFVRDRFRKSLEVDVTRAAAVAKAAPKDFTAVTYHMQSLRAAGRYDEALAVGKALVGDKAQIEIGGNDAFWLVNEYAADLRASGRMEEAIAAMDGVIALGVDRYPELASLMINRAELVIAVGRPKSGLESLAELEAQHFDKLNNFGKMWVWANSACALRALARDDEAKAMDAKLATNPGDNWSAATHAAACRNDTKAVADLLVRRLRDSDARPPALGLFIVFEGREARTPAEQAVEQTMRKARAMPEVQAEFAKYGRAIHYAGTTQGL
jgi:tetratricopeptide (TPR) repeat protein